MRFLCCMLIAVSALGSSRAETLAKPPAWRHFSDQAGATARLAALGKVWGAAKFFHPQLVHSKVDWDAALVSGISQADSARDADAYIQAMNNMLSEIGDPLTKVSISDQPSNRKTDGAYKDPVELRNGTLTIHLMALAANEPTAATALALSNQIAAAKKVVVDLRAGAKADPYVLKSAQQIFSAAIQASSDRPVQVAPMRFRSYFGYPPQHGETSGGYYESLSTQLSPALIGQGHRPMPPMVILVNALSPAMGLVAGLRAAGIARIVQEGQATGTNTTSAEVAPGLTLTLGLAEWIDPASGGDFRADIITQPGRGLRAAGDLLVSFAEDHPSEPGYAKYRLLSERDAPYAEMAFPDRSHRLLALFRYWNVIEYFDPYKNLTRSSWEEVLPHYIPVFERCSNELEYEMAIRSLSAELHDTHGFVGPTRAFARYAGMYTLPLTLRQVEGEAVVTAVLDEALPIHAGDAILTIDGKPVKSQQAWFARYYSASTPQASSAMTLALALRGQQGSKASLTIQTPEGRIRKIEIPRSESISSAALMNARRRKTPSLSVLPGNVAYADLERVQPTDVDSLFKLLQGTKAAIFDLRGYPNGTGWLIASRLGRNVGAAAAVYLVPTPDAYTFGADDAGMSQIIQKVPVGRGSRYAGRVAVLIDESTASQGEHACLLFEAATHVDFVGSKTAGVDGDVTAMVLPGGVSASFSGAAVKHADGRQLQRVGIAPTISVNPTIQGIADGRDEVLEAALQYVRAGR